MEASDISKRPSLAELRSLTSTTGVWWQGDLHTTVCWELLQRESARRDLSTLSTLLSPSLLSCFLPPGTADLTAAGCANCPQLHRKKRYTVHAIVTQPGKCEVHSIRTAKSRTAARTMKRQAAMQGRDICNASETGAGPPFAERQQPRRSQLGSRELRNDPSQRKLDSQNAEGRGASLLTRTLAA